MRLRDAGISQLRYSAPWHRIERIQGTFDWNWLDGPLNFMHENGMEPIFDPLHHTSFPEWLTNGFLHPEFPSLYETFLDRLSRRYPFVRRYTVFNEPLPTTLFCSYTGMWYPHLASDRSFVEMLLQVGRAICCGCEVLRRNVAPEFVHVETAEHHSCRDKASADWTASANARRFLVTDLVLGRVTREHELFPYLVENGAPESELAWFVDCPAHIDILGLDYYIHSEMEWVWDREERRPNMAEAVQERRGFASIAMDYYHRYSLPIMLSETNLKGEIHDRIAWLRWMEAECEQLVQSGVDFRGFCWYPSIDSTDWINACTAATGQIDPQGIWSIDPESQARVHTELSTIYSQLARGQIRSIDIPDYIFGPELNHKLQGQSDSSAKRDAGTEAIVVHSAQSIVRSSSLVDRVPELKRTIRES